MEIFENQSIKYKILIKNNIDYDDTIKIKFIDISNYCEIGYLSFREINYCDSYMMEFEGAEITNIVDEYEPMSIEYIEIHDEYKMKGFGTKLMEYFVQNYMQNNICILLKCSFGVCNEFKNYSDNVILPAFYGKFGFVNVPNSNYMVANLY